MIGVEMEDWLSIILSREHMELIRLFVKPGGETDKSGGGVAHEPQSLGGGVQIE